MRRTLALLALLGTLVPLGAVAGNAPRQQDYQTLQRLSSQERTVLGQLLSLRLAEARAQDLQRQDQAKLAQVSAAAVREQELKARDAAAALTQRHLTGQVLRTVQAAGSDSFLAVLLHASTFAGFVRRLELLQEVFGAEVATLQDYRSSLARVAADLASLEKSRGELARTTAALAAEAADYAALAAQKQAVLNSLGSRRQRYLADLSILDQAWYQGAAPLLQEFLVRMKDLSGAIAAGTVGHLSVDVLSGQADWTVSAAQLDGFVQADPALTGFSFSIGGGQVDVEGTTPGGPLEVSGAYAVVGPEQLAYRVSGVSLDGIPLNGAAEQEVGSQFAAGLSVDLSSQHLPYQLRTVQASGGRLTVSGGLGG
jgi:hypothetical protein